MPRLLLTFGIFTSIVIAGCGEFQHDASATILTLHAREEAHYIIFDPSGAPIGNTSIRSVANGTTLEVEVVVHLEAQKRTDATGGMWAGRDYTEHAIIDATSGALISVRWDNRGEKFEDAFRSASTEFPLGVHRFVPALAAASNAGFTANSKNEFLPLGPQWPLLASPGARQGTGTWGGARYMFTSHEATWEVHLGADCQSGCGRFEVERPIVQESVEWHLRGTWDSIFPETAELELKGVGNVIRMHATDRSFSGKRLDLDWHEPMDPVLELASCAFPPCETAGWSRDHSMQRGLLALERSPLWRAYAQAHPEWKPVTYWLAPTTPDMPPSGSLRWDFFVASATNGAHFVVESLGTPDGMSVEAVTEMTLNDGFTLQQHGGVPLYPRPMATLDQSVGQALARFQSTLDDLRWIIFSVHDTVVFPAPEAHFTYVLAMEENAPIKSLLVSAVTGQVLRVDSWGPGPNPEGAGMTPNDVRHAAP